LVRYITFAGHSTTVALQVRGVSPQCQVLTALLSLLYSLSQIGMLKCVITLYEESQRAIADSPADKRISWSYIKTTLANLIQKVVDCKFVVSLPPRCLVVTWCSLGCSL
jgi:hypothetical protein